jgi:pimeloyl-ACP methyl ester carboxylesterase
MDDAKMGSAPANGLKFAWIEMGSGPLVLALHGFPDTPRTFKYQMRMLAEAGYRVIAPYMRGYAPTDAPAEAAYDKSALAQDAVALLAALSTEPAILIGHDWGAIAAYGAAILAPEKVSRLITLAVPPGGRTGKAFVTNPLQQRRSWYIFFFQMPYAEEAVAYNDFAFIERLWQDWSPNWQIDSKNLEAVKTVFRQPGALTAALSYYRHTFNPANRRTASSVIAARMFDPISVPSLYIHGEADGGIGVEVIEGMEDLFTGPFQQCILPGAGHFVHQEQAEKVNQVILEFLSS